MNILNNYYIAWCYDAFTTHADMFYVTENKRHEIRIPSKYFE